MFHHRMSLLSVEDPSIPTDDQQTGYPLAPNGPDAVLQQLADYHLANYQLAMLQSGGTIHPPSMQAAQWLPMANPYYPYYDTWAAPPFPFPLSLPLVTPTGSWSQYYPASSLDYAPYDSQFHTHASTQLGYNDGTSVDGQEHSLNTPPSESGFRANGCPRRLSLPIVPTGRRIRIPQTIEYMAQPPSTYTVEFSVRGNLGVRVGEIIKNPDTVLDRGNEIVFASTGVRQFRLVVAWPGYDTFGTYIPVQDSDGFINRARLAKLICLHLARFAHAVSKKKAQPGYEQWAVGERGIQLEELWLVSLAQAQQSSWLVELEVQA